MAVKKVLSEVWYKESLMLGEQDMRNEFKGAKFCCNMSNVQLFINFLNTHFVQDVFSPFLKRRSSAFATD
jgi:hypothetical protein